MNEQINNVRTFLWWVQTYFEINDVRQGGEYLFEGPIDRKNQDYLNPHKFLKIPYKKRNTQEEVLEMYKSCLLFVTDKHISCER